MRRGARVAGRLLSATALVTWAATAGAQESTLEFTVSGTSTIRGWTCTARGVLAVTAGSGAALPGFANGVQAATVTVPLKNFACPNPEMTEHLNQAMKSAVFPEIVFRLEKYQPSGSEVQATGAMTIAGSSQPLTLPLTVTAAPGGGAQVEGTTRLDMSAYGVDPPVVMMGLLKVHPQIRIAIKGTVRP